MQHQSPLFISMLTSPWPFSVWGIDIIRMIMLNGTNGPKYVLVAIDYFKKWVEAASYGKITSKHVDKFILNNTIYRYGVPHELTSDQGSHSRNKVVALLEKCRIQHHKSSPYRPQRNGIIDESNKNVWRIIKKMAENYQDWLDELLFAWWGYRMSVRTSTRYTGWKWFSQLK